MTFDYTDIEFESRFLDVPFIVIVMMESESDIPALLGTMPGAFDKLTSTVWPSFSQVNERNSE